MGVADLAPAIPRRDAMSPTLPRPVPPPRPSPNKAILWGSPNACNICHNGKAKNDSPQRMIDAMKKWGIPPMPIKLKAED